MMYLSQEATNKYQSLKMQMLLSLDKDKKAQTEKIWAKNGPIKGLILLFLSQIALRILFCMPICL